MRACFTLSKDYVLEVGDALNLIKACLHLDTQKRIKAREAFNHMIFGGQVNFELEQNSPWNEKADYKEIEKLIYKLKVS